jgi:hypothetical protein
MSKKITFGALIAALMATSCALFVSYKSEAQEGRRVTRARRLSPKRRVDRSHGPPDGSEQWRCRSVVILGGDNARPAERRSVRADKGRASSERLAGGHGDPEAVAADAFIISIAYDGHRVTFVEPNVPKSIRSLSALLNDVIFDIRSR